MAKAMRMSFIGMMVVAFAAGVMVVERAEAETVQYNLSWSVPPVSDFYASWAANHSFVVGDTLVFNFANGKHSVARVTKEAYNACNSTETIFVNGSSPLSFNLTETIDYYFFCTFGDHCVRGQKLAITNVMTPKIPSKGPSPSPVATPPSPPNSSPSLASALSLFLLPIAISLLA